MNRPARYIPLDKLTRMVREPNIYGYDLASGDWTFIDGVRFTVDGCIYSAQTPRAVVYHTAIIPTTKKYYLSIPEEQPQSETDARYARSNFSNINDVSLESIKKWCRLDYRDMKG